MAETEVDARQRATALFRKHLDAHRRFFECWCVSGAIGIAPGQTINGFFDGIHRQVELLSTVPDP